MESRNVIDVVCIVFQMDLEYVLQTAKEIELR